MQAGAGITARATRSNAKVRQRHLLNMDYTQISDHDVPTDRYICLIVNAGIVHCAAGISLTVALKSQSEQTYVSRQPTGPITIFVVHRVVEETLWYLSKGTLAQHL